MPDIAGLLGHDVLAKRLLQRLRDPDTRLIRLGGPSGAGKSHVARQVASAWVEDGGGCVVTVGDDRHASRALYPLLSGLSRAPADWGRIASLGTRSAIGVADTALGDAGAGMGIFDLLAGTFRQRIDRVLKPYSSIERDVILDLRRLGRSRPILLIADNAHWWDADALHLLEDVVSDELRAAIPQLSSLVVLLIETSEEQAVVAPDAFASALALAAAPYEHLDACSSEQYPALLQAFGLENELPPEVLRALYVATNGHLKITEQVVAYAHHNSVDNLVAPVSGDYLATLVAARFASLGSISPEVAELLVCGAVLGLAFTENDLLCISQEERRTTLRELVRRAEEIGFVERRTEGMRFSHEVIRAAILEHRTSGELGALYTKLFDCLSILRPGDYGARADALALAGDVDSARDFRALEHVSKLRRGVPADRVLARLSLDEPDDVELAAYLEVIARAWTAIGEGDFARPIPSLRTPMPRETTVMAAERHYLVALCLMEQQTADGFAEARTVLTSWLPSVDGEGELRLRFLMLLQQVLILDEDFEQAREVESRIEQELLKRERYDPDAAVTLQIQNRRAGAMNTPSIAESRISEAVRFFRRGTTDSSRDQLELFRSLNNLVATHIRTGDFAQAVARAEEAEQIALESPDVMRRLDCLASNTVLAQLRLGAIDAAEAVRRQRLVVESPEGAGDKFLHRSNMASFMLLSSLDDEAEAELRRLGDELERFEFAETYLYFYRAASTVGLAAVRGDTELALRLHRDMATFARTVRWPCAAHVRRRQVLLERLIPTIAPDMSREQVDRILLDASPVEIGPGWDYYSRVFPCAELSYWSDS